MSFAFKGFERDGRYWVRTSDLFRVKEARYPCANRPRLFNLAQLELGQQLGQGNSKLKISPFSTPPTLSISYSLKLPEKTPAIAKSFAAGCRNRHCLKSNDQVGGCRVIERQIGVGALG